MLKYSSNPYTLFLHYFHFQNISISFKINHCFFYTLFTKSYLDKINFFYPLTFIIYLLQIDVLNDILNQFDLEILFNNFSKIMGNVCTTIEQDPLNNNCPHKNNIPRKKSGISSQFKKKEACPLCRQSKQQQHFEQQTQPKNAKSAISLTTQNGQTSTRQLSPRRIPRTKIIKKTIQDFQFVRGLGRGAFGKVYLIKEKSNESTDDSKIDLINLDVQQLKNYEQQPVFEIDVNKIGNRESKTIQQKDMDNENIQSSDESSKIKLIKKNTRPESMILQQKSKQPQYYALKIILKQSLNTKQEKKQALSQRFILQSMNHPFIVKLHYAFQTSTRLFLIVDLLQGGELFYLLRKMKKFDQKLAKFYAAEILLALEYLHQKSIIYRDLKPQNVLLDSEGHIKISDFGLSKIMYSTNQKTYSLCGTPQYIAPEVIMRQGYTQAADWFSFGSLLYDMLTGRPPFLSNNKSAMLKNLVTKPVPLPYYLSNDAKSLLNGLFSINPEERLGYREGAQQIKRHPFFADINFQDLKNKKIKPPIIFGSEENKNEKQEIFLNSGGFQKWNSWHLNMQSPDGKKRKQSRQYYEGFTFQNEGLQNQEQIPEDYEHQQGDN